MNCYNKSTRKIICMLIGKLNQQQLECIIIIMKINFKTFEKIVALNIAKTKIIYYHNTFQNYKKQCETNLESN